MQCGYKSHRQMTTRLVWVYLSSEQPDRGRLPLSQQLFFSLRQPAEFVEQVILLLA
jgi:hypothetical protein